MPPNISFRMMTWIFPEGIHTDRVRDLLRPRESVLTEINLQPGLRLLDYGCGPGGYAIPTARMVG